MVQKVGPVNGSMFNFVESSEWGYPSKFKFAKWMNKEAMREVLLSLTGAHDQGDVYVRRPGLDLISTKSFHEKAGP